MPQWQPSLALSQSQAHCARFSDIPLCKLPSPIVRQRPRQLEIQPCVADAQRLTQARAWGDWGIAQTGSWRPSPPLRALNGRLLLVGYVCADLCKHTVGLFVKEVLQSLNDHVVANGFNFVAVFMYGAGQVKDWVTDAIQAVWTLRKVSNLEDAVLAHLIRQEEIDDLVDLSGHTAGSRLKVFAHRPAPVQVTWVGYCTSQHQCNSNSFKSSNKLDDQFLTVSICILFEFNK